MIIRDNSDGIRIDGYKGSWYTIDKAYLKSDKLDLIIPIFLLESEQHGDEWPALIVTKFGNVICDDVYNGFDDLEQLEDF